MRNKQKLQLLCVTLGFIIFLGLATGVFLQSEWVSEVNHFGQQLIQNRSPIADTFFTHVTQLGSVTFTSLVTLLLSLFLLFQRQYRLFLFLVVNIIISAGFITQLVKHIIKNPRPVTQLIPEHGYSFPSGHTMVSILLYGTLIILIRLYIKNTWLKNIMQLLFLSLIVIIPISRIYINVHYPSDILAGLALGYSLLMLSRYIFNIGEHT
ncbi:phosphatase PAP2 family protein [Leuconostoc rapi]|uniref:phosphatase PAP2 family protein n=1 Tax=Leuconostoc rapi TaxID=1406906 RepID=UPI0019598BB3|nr:phosphatase PAP2 family protein [Leuconostoc rapi]MBM7434873.1 undecaprenyl-diphosphatase [Leuconostoc rapi]